MYVPLIQSFSGAEATRCRASPIKRNAIVIRGGFAAGPAFSLMIWQRVRDLCLPSAPGLPDISERSLIGRLTDTLSKDPQGCMRQYLLVISESLRITERLSSDL
jgi:hypothetical protein